MENILVKKHANNYLQVVKYGKAKLSAHEIELIRQKVASGEMTQKQIVDKFEISKAMVSYIVNFKRR